MSWSSTSCPCCASRRESRHRSWSLSWSRTSARIRIISDVIIVISCHHKCWSRTSAKNRNQLRSDVTNVIGCHHQCCNCTSAKSLHLYSIWRRVEKEGNFLAITKGRNLCGCEYVGHYGQKILSIMYFLRVEDCRPHYSCLQVSKCHAITVRPNCPLGRFTHMQPPMPPRNDYMHFCPS